MPKTNTNTLTQQSFSFTLTHAEILALMNSQNVVLEGGHVDPNTVFTLVLQKSNGQQILLKDMQVTDTLVFQFNVVSVSNTTQTFNNINVS